MAQRRVLIIDDSPDTQKMLAEQVIEPLGYQPIVAWDGEEGLELSLEQRPHLIILDIHLSDMDGRVVCERVKKRPETRSTRALAISGYLDDEEAERLPDHGFDAYLKKPFSMAELAESVRKLFELPSGKVARPSKPTTP